MIDHLLHAMALIALGAPWLVFCLIGVLVWLHRPLAERVVSTMATIAFCISALACCVAATVMGVRDVDAIRLPVGTWLSVEHHSLTFELVLDQLALPCATFGAILVGLVGVFSRRYLHRDPGFVRFYLLLALLGAGFELVVLAGSLEMVVFGWELVGVSSALLIAFFHYRASPVRHGLRAFVTYRVCDVALITAAIWLHHVVGATNFHISEASWAAPVLPTSPAQITAIGLMLVFATMGKSAQFPLTGWLPRAMEGPTPSSAIFYGALSIHLGPYLLLRSFPFLQSSTLVSATVFVVGLMTVFHATFVGRVQTDIKSALVYASVTQVGLIYVEIALGFRVLALVHILGHAAIRALQILRSPSLLHDYHHLERAMGRQLPRTGRHLERLVPRRWQPWFYRYALERGYVDALLHRYLAVPLERLLYGIDRMERRWTAWLGGSRSRVSDSRLPSGARSEVT